MPSWFQSSPKEIYVSVDEPEDLNLNYKMHFRYHALHKNQMNLYHNLTLGGNSTPQVKLCQFHLKTFWLMGLSALLVTNLKQKWIMELCYVGLIMSWEGSLSLVFTMSYQQVKIFVCSKLFSCWSTFHCC